MRTMGLVDLWSQNTMPVAKVSNKYPVVAYFGISRSILDTI